MKKSLLINTFIVIGSVAVLLVVLEILLTFIDYPPRKPYLQEFYGPGFKLMCYDRPPSSGYNLDLREDAARLPYEKIFNNAKNAEFFLYREYTPYAVIVRYNSDGFREKEFAAKKPGIKRIVVLGDSFTYGHGLDNALSYPRVMERLLKEKCRGDAYEVLNLGVGAADIDTMHRLTPLILSKLKPDILIYGYFLNDPVGKTLIARKHDVHEMLDQGWLNGFYNGRYSSLGSRERIRPYVYDMVAYLLRSIKVSRETLKWYRDMHSPEAWASTAEAVEEMKLAAQKQNCRFIMVLLPVIYRIDDSPFTDIHRYIGAEMKRKNVEVIDGLNALNIYRDDMLYLHSRDRHPNALYHQKVAETIINRAGLCDYSR